MESYEKLTQLVADVRDDIQKAEGGNKAAGTRVRKAMQEIKKAAQDVRQAVLDLRDQDDSSGPSTGGSPPPPGGAGGMGGLGS